MSLPVDDLRHCPAWLRLSDGRIGSPANSQRSKKPSRHYIPKKIIAIKNGIEITKEPLLTSEMAKKLSMPGGTIRTLIKSGKKSRDGYFFKVVDGGYFEVNGVKAC